MVPPSRRTRSRRCSRRRALVGVVWTKPGLSVRRRWLCSRRCSRSRAAQHPQDDGDGDAHVPAAARATLVQEPSGGAEAAEERTKVLVADADDQSMAKKHFCQKKGKETYQLLSFKKKNVVATALGGASSYQEQLHTQEFKRKLGASCAPCCLCIPTPMYAT